jgi:hypothetical protein
MKWAMRSKRAGGKVAARSGDIMLASIFAGQLSFATQKSCCRRKTHLACATITDKHELEGRSLLLSHFEM